MLFRQLFDKTSSTYTYLLGCEQEKLAILIDPVREQLSLYERLLNELQLRLVASLDTHLHADHITASGPLHEKYGSQIIMGAPCLASPVSKIVEDGEKLQFGNIKITCLYTPGHTDDSFCYLLSDRVFTGDTLLIRGTGRTDFQHGSPELAYQSLFTKLLTLPEQTLVYPAHDYKGETVSTMGEEKNFNPRLQVANAQEYADIMNNLNLARPEKMDIAIPANLHCGLPKQSENLNEN